MALNHFSQKSILESAQIVSFYLLRHTHQANIFSRDTVRKRFEGRKEMFYLTTHSTHYIYCYMALDIWYRTIQIEREETCCHHMGYSF